MTSKKKAAIKLKNILAQPFPRYWPEVDSTNCTELKRVISKEASKNGEVFKSGISLGLQSSLRYLNNDKISTLLLSTEIKPKFVVTQIIYSTLRKDNVHVLCIPNLKEITKEEFGIEALALGIIRNTNLAVQKWAEEKSKMLPLPRELFIYLKGEEESQKEAYPSIKKVNGSSKSNDIEMFDPSNLYLQRPTGQSRVFVPNNAGKLEPLGLDNSIECADYISLSNDKFQFASLMQISDEEDLETEKFKLVNKIKTSVKQTEVQNVEWNAHVFNSKNRASVSNKRVANDSNDVSLRNINNKETILIKNKKDKKKNSAHKTNFLNYISLKVHKIQRNPNKKVKVKRK